MSRWLILLQQIVLFSWPCANVFKFKTSLWNLIMFFEHWSCFRLVWSLYIPIELSFYWGGLFYLIFCLLPCWLVGDPSYSWCFPLPTMARTCDFHLHRGRTCQFICFIHTTHTHHDDSWWLYLDPGLLIVIGFGLRVRYTTISGSVQNSKTQSSFWSNSPDSMICRVETSFKTWIRFVPWGSESGPDSTYLIHLAYDSGTQPSLHLMHAEVSSWRNAETTAKMRMKPASY